MGFPESCKADQGGDVSIPIPYYTYPGQALDEMGSLATVMPKFQRLAFDIANTPGSTDMTNVIARGAMTSGITPYQQ